MRKANHIVLTMILTLFLSNINLINAEAKGKRDELNMSEVENIIEFPLRGEWFTETSPANRIPSHGTNQFGLRYAFDFIKVSNDGDKLNSHKKKKSDYFFSGISLEDYYCFDKPIYALFSGEVVITKNSTSDGEKASWISDQSQAIWYSLFFDPKKDGFEAIGGNYVILKKTNNVFAAFCHLRKDSIVVKEGDYIEEGSQIGKVGHSGNSTEPHLHFQLMDSIDIENAKGLPFIFREYERLNGSSWEKVKNSLPSEGERVRYQ